MIFDFDFDHPDGWDFSGGESIPVIEEIENDIVVATVRRFPDGRVVRTFADSGETEEI